MRRILVVVAIALLPLAPLARAQQPPPPGHAVVESVARASCPAAEPSASAGDAVPG